VAEALHQRLQLVGALRVRERVLERVQLGCHLRHRARAVHGLGERGPTGHLAHVLREVADGHAAVDGDLALVGRLLARDQAEQGGLAGAVRADEADLLAAVDDGGGLHEEELVAVLLGDGVEADHEGRVLARRTRRFKPARRRRAGRALRCRP
jgi:hypothetical protein